MFSVAVDDHGDRTVVREGTQALPYDIGFVSRR